MYVHVSVRGCDTSRQCTMSGIPKFSQAFESISSYHSDISPLYYKLYTISGNCKKNYKYIKALQIDLGDENSCINISSKTNANGVSRMSFRNYQVV